MVEFHAAFQAEVPKYSNYGKLDIYSSTLNAPEHLMSNQWTWYALKKIKSHIHNF